MIYARKKDTMHTPIVRTLIGVGAVVKETYQHPEMLDVIVAFRGRLFWAEIKNNAKTAEKELTPAERELIQTFATVGVKIHVWTSPEQALKEIGAIL